MTQFWESNLKYSINGYMFGNTPGLDMQQNTHVRWYVAGMGNKSGCTHHIGMEMH